MKLLFVLLIVSCLLLAGCAWPKKTPTTNTPPIINPTNPSNPINPTTSPNTTNPTQPNSTTNTPTQPPINPNAVDVSGKTLSDILKMNRSLECDVVANGEGYSETDKWFISNTNSFRFEPISFDPAPDPYLYSPCKNAGVITILNNGKISTGCKEGSILSYVKKATSCLWIQDTQTSTTFLKSIVDSRYQIQKCQVWKVDSTKFDTSGKICSPTEPELLK